MTVLKQPIPSTIQTLWEQLTPAQQGLVAQLMAALAGQASPPVVAADRLAALFGRWEAEESTMTPEEAAAAEAEWQAIATDLDAHRLSDRPLFP
jgi:hypothetical protein